MPESQVNYLQSPQPITFNMGHSPIQKQLISKESMHQTNKCVMGPLYTPNPEKIQKEVISTGFTKTFQVQNHQAYHKPVQSQMSSFNRNSSKSQFNGLLNQNQSSMVEFGSSLPLNTEANDEEIQQSNLYRKKAMYNRNVPHQLHSKNMMNHPNK